MKYAPLLVFVYNRPLHLEKVLDALSQNAEAKESILYIFCDGPKINDESENIAKINSVRSIARRENRFKKVAVTERETNKGLAASIIEGVTEIINKHGSAIVLEDDILVSRGFLSYMNEALALYESTLDVGCIHGWNYTLDPGDYKTSTFFLRGADCWGWATWKRAWDLFEPDGEKLLQNVLDRNLQYEFDRQGTHSFVKMLKEQTEGKNNSWAIRWYASLFLQNKYCLQPTKPVVKNIGLDNSGTHCDDTGILQETVDHILLGKIPVEESKWFFQAYKKSLASSATQTEQWKKEKNFLKKLFLL